MIQILAFALALPPPCPAGNPHDDDRCPRRECLVKTLMPQMLQPSEAVDEQIGASIYVKDTSEFAARFC